MENHKLNLYKSFKIPKVILSIFAYWPNSKTPFSAKIKATAAFSIQFIFVATVVVQMAYSYSNSPNIFLEVLTVFTAISSYMLKHISFIWYEKEFLKLYEFLGDNTLVSIHRHLHPLMQKHLRIAKLLGVGYLLNCAITVLLYNAIPLITEKSLPIYFTFFDLGKLEHAAIYLLQVGGMSQAAANNTALDLLAYNFMCIINGQAQVLNEKIRSFGGLKCADSEKNLIEYLGGCVHHHNKIIILTNKVEKVFSMILLSQYLTSIMVICNIGFQLVTVKIFSLSFFVMLSFFLAMMCEMGIYCWFGNEIILNSLAIRDACYDSDWIDSSIKVRKMLIIIMERGKRPLYLTAGKFSTLSLPLFTSVINSAYSFFALMQRMYRPPENE